jgi:serine/threonine protein kinase
MRSYHKQVKRRHFKILNSVNREFKILRLLKLHDVPLVTQIYGAFCGRGNIYYVFEYCPSKFFSKELYCITAFKNTKRESLFLKKPILIYQKIKLDSMRQKYYYRCIICMTR